MGITGAGIVLLGVFILRGVVGFREDYLYFKKEKLSLRSYYKYLKNKVKRGWYMDKLLGVIFPLIEKGVIKNESYIR